MPKVFIVNKGGHDYSPATQYGELVFLSENKLNPFKIGRVYPTFKTLLSSATAEDFLLPCSLGALNALAGWILGNMGLKLNLLIFDKKGYYVPRNVVFQEENTNPESEALHDSQEEK